MSVNERHKLTQTGSRGSKKPASSKKYESRADWTIAYRTGRKRHDWESDYSGIVRLTQTGLLYWVNCWHNRNHFALSLQPKDGSADKLRCRLEDNGSGRYSGPFQLGDVCYEVELQEEAGHLRIHFERSTEP